MSKRLQKVFSILCLISMLFTNLSLDSLFGVSGRIAIAESAVDPMKRVDLEMKSGEERQGEIKAGETFTTDNITVKRPGNGISPMKWYEVLGQKADLLHPLDDYGKIDSQGSYKRQYREADHHVFTAADVRQCLSDALQHG